MQENIVLRDEVPEWHWWTRLPNIVLSKVGDPYELALLFVLRKVAGDAEDGVCYMSLRSLAEVAKMGLGTVHRKIHSLAGKGLIEARLKKAPKGWKVWHIKVPRSLWEENERVYGELFQRRCEVPLEEPSVPEGNRSVPEGNRSVPEMTPTKNHITKNHIKKKVETLSERKDRLSKKNGHGRYIDRSPLEKCKECGQYLRECICGREEGDE